MRALTSQEIERLKLLTENSVELALIEPTANGLKKSIMDATGRVRSYLKAKSVHDYETQRQGRENKIQIPATLITRDRVVTSIASLYRPITKKGDPRIWFTGLNNYANASDILGVFEFEKVLYVLNITQLKLQELLEDNLTNPINELIGNINDSSNLVADELLTKLKTIAARGFIPALLNADTSVGRTLESLLGIPMNSSKTPDYKGIELKSAREKRGTRKQLFAKTPNWELSKFKSRIEVLDAFGYWKKGVFRLYNTIRATGRNPQGLILKTDYDLDYLIENSDKEDIGDFLIWKFDELKSALATKHKETFWIEAQSKFEDEKEHFHYKSAEHTKRPMLNQFGALVDIGVITLDYPIKRLSDGSIEDKGCNFKLRPNALSLLFPPSRFYALTKI